MRPAPRGGPRSVRIPKRFAKRFAKLAFMEETTHSVPAPGEGPAVSVSASLHEGTVEAVRARAGKRGFSAYVEDAVLHQIRRDNLREIVESHTAQYGEFTEEEMAEARSVLYGPAEDRRGSAA